MILGSNQSSPLKSACGIHSNDHMNDVGSPSPAQAQIALGSVSASRPNSSSDSAR
jgi:hypothetical protein